MPIYEFECANCGARFEELTDSGDVAAACPQCGSEQAERRFSQVSPRGSKVRDSESRRREREAARRERIGEARKARRSS